MKRLELCKIKALTSYIDKAVTDYNNIFYCVARHTHST